MEWVGLDWVDEPRLYDAAGMPSQVKQLTDQLLKGVMLMLLLLLMLMLLPAACCCWDCGCYWGLDCG